MKSYIIPPPYIRQARETFSEIKTVLKKLENRGNVCEFEKSLQKIVTEYNTADWENRFVVGGAIEALFCALLRSMNFECDRLRETRYDILVNNRVRFSLKSNFTGSGGIRLINFQGDQRAEWEEPTLFFLSNIGICYADPYMGLRTESRNDAISINIRELSEIVNNDRWRIDISIPKKPKSSLRIKTASYDVVKSILQEIDSRYLLTYLPE